MCLCEMLARRHEAQLRADVVVLINELNVQEDDRRHTHKKLC